MNQNFNEKIKEAERSEGYLILVTRLNNKKLIHTYFTQTFPRGDIPIALNEYKKLLEKEMIVKSTVSKEKLKKVEEKVEEKKEMPPEYRK